MSKEPLTEERIAEIRGREKAATQGPWVVQDKGAIPLIYGPDGERVAKVIDHQEDVAFIAHAREDIPTLLDEGERLRAELKKADDRTKFWIYFSALLAGGRPSGEAGRGCPVSLSDLPEMSRNEL